VKSVEMPSDRNHPEFSRGYAYVDFEAADDATKAVQHMNGGRSCFFFDGKLIRTKLAIIFYNVCAKV